MEAIAYRLPLVKSRPVYALLAVHVVMGALFFLIPLLTPVYIILYTLYSISVVIQTANKTDAAAYAAVYLAAIEILLRLSRQFILYEYGKYSVVLILLIALLIEKKKRKIPIQAILYFVLLLPSIFVGKYVDFLQLRTLISFNLSGPASLALSWIYFSGRKINRDQFKQIVLNFILPLVAVVVFIVLKIPSNASFGTEYSNKLFSGGFGPNQVSLVLGFGFFITSLSILLGIKITQSIFLDIVLAFLFLGFGVLTFSRGGVVAGVLCFLASCFIYIRSGKGSKRLSRMFFGVVFFGIAAYFGWQILNRFTENTITNRYVNTVNGPTGNKGTVDLSGRDDLMSNDFEAFFAHPLLGNGPSGAVAFRSKKYGNDLEAHTEFTRLLGDHGMLGLFAVVILISSGISNYRKSKGPKRIISVGFVLAAVLNMLHAAMRLAIPGLAFGFAFADFDFDEHPLEKSPNTQ